MATVLWTAPRGAVEVADAAEVAGEAEVAVRVAGHAMVDRMANPMAGRDLRVRPPTIVHVRLPIVSLHSASVVAVRIVRWIATTTASRRFVVEAPTAMIHAPP